MTDDEIIKMLKEIDMCTHTYDNGMHIITTYDITKMRRFAERVTAAEREACAKACADIPLPTDSEELTHLPTIDRCIAAIRARGK
jgi:hypothetical protein